MRFPAVFCLLSIVVAVRSSCVALQVNPGVSPPADGIQSAVWSYGDRISVPRVQQIFTKPFRNQRETVKNARAKWGYWAADDATQTVKWEKVPQGTDYSLLDDAVAADHIFELQILTMWMNNRKITDAKEYFDKEMTKVRDLLNGGTNAVYISSDVNNKKGTLIRKVMKKVLENKSCSKPPKTALTDYLAHPDIEKILREVLAKLTLYIAEVDMEGAYDFRYAVLQLINCVTTV